MSLLRDMLDYGVGKADGMRVVLKKLGPVAGKYLKNGDGTIMKLFNECNNDLHEFEYELESFLDSVKEKHTK